MKQFLIIFLAILLFLPITLATTEYQTIVVPINMSVENDWNGTCSVRLFSENDDVIISPKKFSCWDNTTFENIEINSRHDIDVQPISIDNSNLSSAMKNLTQQYYEFITYANYTRNYFDKYSEMKSAHDIVTERYTTCKEERDVFETENSNLSSNYNECDDELRTTTTERDNTASRLSECNQNLTKTQSDKTTWAVGALLLGILGTYFTLKRNRPKTDESKQFGNLPEGFPGFEEPPKDGK